MVNGGEGGGEVNGMKEEYRGFWEKRWEIWVKEGDWKCMCRRGREDLGKKSKIVNGKKGFYYGSNEKERKYP
ncbi:hypothetical protein Tco_0116835 [Tanacetum coccineum]